jgi:phosphoglycolate phosphatase-like HAD superfamily hydrolase
VAAIIFDFDGTIADSFDYVANFLAKEAGRPPLSEVQQQPLRGRSMIAMARYLGFSWWRLPRLLVRGRRQMKHVITHLKPFKDMPELIKKLHAEGHELFIISTNNVSNVHQFLHPHNVHDYFLEIYGGVGLFSKAPALRRLIKEQNLERQNALYIGDEVRDMEAARAAHVRRVAVTWGFARPAALRAQRPYALVETPAELLSILENI